MNPPKSFSFSPVDSRRLLLQSHLVNQKLIPSSPTVSIRLANFASSMDSTIMLDHAGDICLLQRVRDEAGVSVLRHAPDHGNFHPESDWLMAIAGGYAENLVV